MTDKDTDLYKGQERTPYQNEDGGKKKKTIIGVVVGVVVVVAIILIIVLASGGSDHKKPDNPPVGPTVNPAFEHFNPYSVDGKVEFTESGYSGKLKGTFHKKTQTLADLSGFQELYGLEADKKPVTPVTPPKDAGSLLAVDINQIPTGVNNNPVEEVSFEFSMINFHTAKLEIGNKDAPKIPSSIVADPMVDTTKRMEMLGFDITTDKGFSFKFKDAETDVNWINTFNNTMVFADKYTQMDFTLPSWNLTGFGERAFQTNLTQGAWTMWSKEQTPMEDNGLGSGLQQQGVHPFIMFKNPKSGKFGGMFFRNANNQAPIIRFNFTDATTTDLSYITTGGKIEVYFFLAGSPEFVLQQYQAVFGMPRLPPFWSLGWQQAGSPYTDHKTIEAVLKGYADMKLPLETVFLGEGSMDHGMPFTIDNEGFMMNTPAEQRSILVWVKENFSSKNMWVVPTIHPGIPINKDLEVYDVFNKEGALIKSAIHKDKNGGFLTADTALLKQANFPDFTQDSSELAWAAGVESLVAQLRFGGVNIKYDGPYTTCNGECPGVVPPPTPPQLEAACLNPDFVLKDSPSDYIFSWYKVFTDQKTQSTFNVPFSPGYAHGLFDDKTVSLNSTMSADGKTEMMLWDLRNLYGLMTAQKTYSAMTSEKYDYQFRTERPFIASETTFSSASGSYAHYLGSFKRSYDWMKHSIEGIMNMNLLGVPLTGADVCGTTGAVDDEMLCARWYQLATFYPIVRNNYMDAKDASEPYLLKDKAAQAMVKAAMNDRMMITRYLYTVMFEASKNGGAIFKPMYFEYPEDSDAYFNLYSDFLFGNHVKVSPVLADVAEYDSYFPGVMGEAWVNIFNTADIQLPGDAKVNKRAMIKPADHVNAYLRPGSIIPIQSLEYISPPDTEGIEHAGTAKTTAELVNDAKMSLMINPDNQGQASGTVLLDDGLSLTNLENEMYDYYQFVLTKGSIKKEWMTNDSGSGGLPNRDTAPNNKIEKIIIVNVADKTEYTFACWADSKQNMTPLQIIQDTENKKYTFIAHPGLEVQIDKMQSFYFGTKEDNNVCNKSLRTWTVVDPKSLDLSSHMTTFQLMNTQDQTAPKLQVTVSALMEADFRVQMSVVPDAKVPATMYKPFSPPNLMVTDFTPDTRVKLEDYIKIDTASGDAYSLKIMSKIDKTTVIFDTTDHDLYMSQYFMVWGSNLMTQMNDQFFGAFGLGERVDHYFLQTGTYSFWNRGHPNELENGELPGKNNYGTHPFLAYKSPVLASTGESTFVSMFFNNAAANDVIIENDMTTGTVSFDYISIGGQFDLFINERNQVDQLVQRYQKLVGNPVMVPQWLLGWNQSRYGYKNTAALETVASDYKKAGIPLDTMWSDIDYMSQYEDFTVDTMNYSGLGKFVDFLHTQGQHYIPIVDAGIASMPGGDYKTYNDGVAAGVFLNDYTGKAPFVGRVWPGDAVFIDWSHPQAHTFWQQEIAMLAAQVDFDGIWLDMNEAENFCNGPCYTNQKAPDTILNNAPYWPTGRDLNSKIIDVNALHHDGSTELEAHNMWAYGEVMATNEYFTSKNMRPAIISRSSYAGQGHYGSRWLGDNFSNELNMQLSVPGIMMMNMFGIPVIGADVCGFLGDTTPELCARWTKLAQFYPFARNHNDIHAVDQEPYSPMFNVPYPGSFNPATQLPFTFAELIKQSISERYSFIPYLYSNVHEMFHNGGTYFKPLFHECPTDANCYKDIESNFLLGDGIKVGIANKLGATEENFYFPKGSWCPMDLTGVCINQINRDGSSLLMPDGKTEILGAYMPMPATADVAQVHFRGGAIVPMVDAPANKVMKVGDLQKLTTDFHVSPIPAGEFGWTAFMKSYYTDDGTTVDSMDTTKGTVNKYQIAAGSVDLGSWVINVDTKIKADKKMDATSKCLKTSMNDFLGDIYIHNAKFYNVQLDAYQIFVVFNDGTLLPSEESGDLKDSVQAEYITGKDGEKKTLKLMKYKTGLCLNSIKQIVIRGPIIDEEDLQNTYAGLRKQMYPAELQGEKEVVE